MSTTQNTFDQLTRAGAHRLDQAGASRPYQAAHEAKFRSELLNLLQTYRALQMTTLDEDGYPYVCRGPYAAVAGRDNKPIVYFFTQNDAAECAHILREPRVSLLQYRAISFEQRRETRSTQMQGVARLLSDPAEIAKAREAGAALGDEVASCDAIIEIETAFATYSSLAARPQGGAIDYAPAPETPENRDRRARGRIAAIVDDIRQLPGDVVAIKFLAEDGGELAPFPPGSHIQVYVGNGLVRPYSLCSLASGADGYHIAVLREPNSRGGSEIICKQWRVGERVIISEPRNFYPLDRRVQKAILIGAGVGVTPLAAMAEHFDALGIPFELHYCYRNDDRASFKEQFANLSFADKVRSHASSERRFSFVDDVGGAQSDTHIYVCGPQGFMDSVLAAARSLGWTNAHLHQESFGGEADTEGDPFSVTLDDGKTFNIPAGKTIAHVLMGEGYEIEMACERGICGSCIAEVKEGLPDHRDHFLTDLEKMGNDRIALCCSRAKTPSLRISLPD